MSTMGIDDEVLLYYFLLPLKYLIISAASDPRTTTASNILIKAEVLFLAFFIFLLPVMTIIYLE